jgi:hypothetical protein
VSVLPHKNIQFRIVPLSLIRNSNNFMILCLLVRTYCSQFSPVTFVMYAKCKPWVHIGPLLHVDTRSAVAVVYAVDTALLSRSLWVAVVYAVDTALLSGSLWLAVVHAVYTALLSRSLRHIAFLLCSVPFLEVTSNYSTLHKDQEIRISNTINFSYILIARLFAEVFAM